MSESWDIVLQHEDAIEAEVRNFYCRMFKPYRALNNRADMKSEGWIAAERGVREAIERGYKIRDWRGWIRICVRCRLMNYDKKDRRRNHPYLSERHEDEEDFAHTYSTSEEKSPSAESVYFDSNYHVNLVNQIVSWDGLTKLEKFYLSERAKGRQLIDLAAERGVKYGSVSVSIRHAYKKIRERFAESV